MFIMLYICILSIGALPFSLLFLLLSFLSIANFLQHEHLFPIIGWLLEVYILATSTVISGPGFSIIKRTRASFIQYTTQLVALVTCQLSVGVECPVLVLKLVMFLFLLFLTFVL